jgi:hypothetical protein
VTSATATPVPITRRGSSVARGRPGGVEIVAGSSSAHGGLPECARVKRSRRSSPPESVAARRREMRDLERSSAACTPLRVTRCTA